MADGDLRQYIRRLEDEHEITHVGAEVDWDLEIGAISRKAMDRKSGALLFDNVKGYPGFRIMANILGPSQPIHGILALALGLPKHTPVTEIINWFDRKTEERILPVVVGSAPCKENILRGDEVNLLKLPAPRIHGVDGGRYIGTWHVNVIKDPDTGWVNWATYRHQLHDERRMGWLASPVQQGPSIFYRKYEARNEPMPMAVCIGTDVISSLAAASDLPPMLNEVDVAGALQGEPVKLVKCETLDLEVPASSEIVLEGYVAPHERMDEGPFGEFTGYTAGGRAPRPVFHVECVSFRNNPILTMSNMGKPWDDMAIIASVLVSALLSQELRKRGIPVRGVYCPPPSLAPIVSARSQYAGFIHSVASTIWSSKPGIDRPFVIMVGEDVDPTNLEEVFWCLTSRLHPDRGIHIHRGTPAMPLLPFISGEERRSLRGARAAFDATFPPDWPTEDVPTVIDLQNGWPKEIQDKVAARWAEYGIK